jgi:hypothetical protein
VFVSNQQKKTALEVLSKICSSNFPTVLQKISKHEETIEKIKS